MILYVIIKYNLFDIYLYLIKNKIDIKKQFKSIVIYYKRCRNLIVPIIIL